jgi:hypothetical protein
VFLLVVTNSFLAKELERENLCKSILHLRLSIAMVSDGATRSPTGSIRAIGTGARSDAKPVIAPTATTV